MPRQYTPRQQGTAPGRRYDQTTSHRGRGGQQTTAAPRGRSGQQGATTTTKSRCVATQFDISIKPKSIVYCYGVRIFLKHPGSRQPFEVTEKKNTEYNEFTRACISLLDIDCEYVYDGYRCLYTTSEINPTLTQLTVAQFTPEIVKILDSTSEIRVEVSIPENGYQLDISDLSMYDSTTPLLVEDRSIRTTIEQLINQSLASNNKLIVLKNGACFQNQGREVDCFYKQHCGHTKGVHIVRDKKNDSVKAILAMDARKKMFFPALTLDVIYRRCLNAGMSDAGFCRAYRGVRVRLLHQPSRILSFGGNLTNSRLQDLCLDDGASLVDFYRNRKNTTLCQLDLPAAKMMRANGDFPLELLLVLPNQVVPANCFNDNVSKIQKQLMDATERYQSIMESVALLNNPTLASFGITINTNLTNVEPTRVTANKPAIQGGDNAAVRFNYRNAGFSLTRLAHPASLSKWMILYSGRDDRLAQDLGDALQAKAKHLGMQISAAHIEKYDTRKGYRYIHDLLRNYSAKGLELALRVGRKDDDFHNTLKLAEFMTGVVTQDICNAFKASRDSKVQENIVLKLNLKAGGQNANVSMNPTNTLNVLMKDVLVIGYDVCHATGERFTGEQTKPSFVGISANYGPDPAAFAGTFFAQPAIRTEAADATKLELYATKMLNALKTNNRPPPTKIIILRDGVSEGQYNMVVTQEVPAIEAAFKKLYPNRTVSIVCFIVTKDVNVRHFMLDASNNPSNLPPGTFIFDGVRKDCKQFFTATHNSSIGVTRTALVTIIRDDLSVKRPDVLDFFQAMAYDYQIVEAPTSLPAPIMQADALAERGFELYCEAEKCGILREFEDKLRTLPLPTTRIL